MANASLPIDTSSKKPALKLHSSKRQKLAEKVAAVQEISFKLNVARAPEKGIICFTSPENPHAVLFALFSEIPYKFEKKIREEAKDPDGQFYFRGKMAEASEYMLHAWRDGENEGVKISGLKIHEGSWMFIQQGNDIVKIHLDGTTYTSREPSPVRWALNPKAYDQKFKV